MNIATETQVTIVIAVFLLIIVLVLKNKIKEIGLGPGKVILFNPKEIAQNDEKARKEAEQDIPSADNELKLNNSASLFWLGNDLMWISDMIYRGAPPDTLLKGINSVTHYLNDLGFVEKSYPQQRIAWAKDILESINTPNVTVDYLEKILKPHYETILFYIQSVKWYISALAERKQPSFKKIRG